MDCDLELGKSQNTTRLVQRTAWGGGRRIRRTASVDTTLASVGPSKLYYIHTPPYSTIHASVQQNAFLALARLSTALLDRSKRRLHVTDVAWEFNSELTFISHTLSLTNRAKLETAEDF